MKSKLTKALVLLLSIAMIATQIIVPVMATSVACTCDERDPATDEVVEVLNEPTCGGIGYGEYMCAACGGTYQTTISNEGLEHVYADVEELPAKCGVAGHTAYQECTVCFDKQGYSEIPALEHVEGEPVVENEVSSACGVEGSHDEVVYCTRLECGVELSRVTVSDTALEHELKFVSAVDATCEAEGNVAYYICTREGCGAKFEDEAATTPIDNVVIEKLPHDWNEEVDDPADDCTKPGTIYKTCKNCPATDEEVIPGEEQHVYVIVDTGANCTTATKVKYGCTKCKVTMETEYVGDPLGHDLVIVPGTPADCENDGTYTYYKCNRCNFVSEDEAGKKEIKNIDEWKVQEKLNHSWDVGVVTAPTCTAGGYTTYTCGTCGDTKVPEEEKTPINIYAHNMQITKEAVEATCSQEGFEAERTCQNDGCGYVIVGKSLGYDADNHNIEFVEGKVQNCTEPGTNAYYVCLDCDAAFEDEEATKSIVDVDSWKVIPADGHDLEFVKGFAAECEKAGVNDYYICKTEGCGAAFEDAEATKPIDDLDSWKVIEALEHDHGTSMGHVEPTCTTDGWDAWQCTLCNEIYRENEDKYPALGHDLILVEGYDAECEATGKNDYYDCSRCDFISADEAGKEPIDDLAEWIVIPELGHDRVEDAGKEATCTESGLTAGYHCANGCDDAEENLAQEVIPAKGHTYSTLVVKSFCDEEGYFTITCGRCDTTFDSRTDVEETQEYLDKLGPYIKIDVSPKDHIPGEPVKENCVPSTHYEYGSCEEVVYCAREGCGIELSRETKKLPLLDEEITFTYDASGINGSEIAVNSGYIYLDVYMNVNTEVARLYGLDFSIAFNENLSLVGVEGSIFDVSDFTPFDKANENHVVSLGQSQGYKVENKTLNKGEYLFATLVFKVDAGFHTKDAEFTVEAGAVTRVELGNDLVNNLDVNFGEGVVAEINVYLLGDGNNDGLINTNDVLEFSKWYASAGELDYETMYDMNKDGYVDGDDFVLLRGAVVGDDGYLFDKED